MYRPVTERLAFAESQLRQFRGLALIRSIDLQRTLADFRLPAVFAEHVLHETNDKS
jgi:hypothetical protein